MKYDWIVVGAGITGASLAYELAKQGLKVLLLDKELNPANATLYSYGGLAYWSGTAPLTRQLFAEGITLHRNLSKELEADTGFRDIDLLLTIAVGENPQTYLEKYSHFGIKPELLNVAEACIKEPLLNREAIAGVLRFPHGQINPIATTQAYQQAFKRLGGEFKIEGVEKLEREGDRFQGVITKNNKYNSKHTVLCIGGLTETLLENAGVSYTVKFTHEQVLITPPVNISLKNIIMTANLQRLKLEDQKIYSSIVDFGAVPFSDGHLMLGQVTTLHPDHGAILDSKKAEMLIRENISSVLPSLANLPATLCHCLVAFSDPDSPLVGALKNYQGIYLFTGFTSTLLFAPVLARHFATQAANHSDPIMVLE
jgi:glycine/D-amino acid oxidase-like deaminating enzyme